MITSNLAGIVDDPLPARTATARPRLDGSLLFLTLSLLPVLRWFVLRLDDGSDEPYGLIPLAIAAALTWRDRSVLTAGIRARLGAAFLILASIVAIPWLPPMLRAVFAVLGVAFWFGTHRQPALAALLLLSLPLVASLQFYAGYPMRVAAAEGAVRLIELTGATTARTGTSIELDGRVLGVDPACSGIRMLWHGLVAAMALAAIHRAKWQTCATGAALALILVIPANMVRATWLALEESNRIPHTGISHGGVGLICFAVILIPLWFPMSRYARPRPVPPTVRPISTSRLPRMILAITALLAILSLVRPDKYADRIVVPSTKAPLAFSFDGITMPLDPFPVGAAELEFSRSFPGSISAHRWGEKQVILREVTKATRRLHSSRDCLRASGYTAGEATSVRLADGEWSKFVATRGSVRLVIHERIVSVRDESIWTDVSAWFWSALGHPLNGPWRAVTVISC